MSDHDLLIQISERVKRTDENMQELRQIVVGNGDPTKGLVYQVAKLAEEREERQAAHKRMKALAYTTIGSAITAVIGAAVTVFSGKS